MPINLEKLDALQDKYSKQEREYAQHVSNLKFVREKILHGTADEKKLIDLISKLTIESLEEIIKSIKEASERIL